MINITANTFPAICSLLNSKVDTNHVDLDGLELADYGDDNSGDTIDILIGVDHYWDVITGDVVRGESGPRAVSSKLAWLLSGQVPIISYLVKGRTFRNSKLF